ncbi:MAG: copper amine oxidase N-terminal domain-containing protein [Clostridiales bacterium]|uniref:hypothetical protein n=1 Tax=Flavonifractor porci TaxID=3133422 RepID=UPI0030AB1667|nr:copper amine oxidase N-terminal domain-containing protein [Clostridiales bacterium]
MKKFNHNTIKGFGAGLLAAAVIAGSGLPAYAMSAFKQINVSMGGISLYVDGKLQVPTDVNGNEVEPLIYAGTTYLPVRALTGMLTDKPVEWDPKTESVYIGLKPGAGKVVRADELKPYNESYAVARTGSNAQFKLLGETQTPFNLYRDGETVKLDGRYTELNGEFVAKQDTLNSDYTGTLSIYAVDQYGTKNLIDSYELKSGDEPVSVHTNIRGCDYLYIGISGVNNHGTLIDYGYFYNVTFTEASAG